jgi:hypothetical protein
MLVRESISFERGSDPKKTLGIGEENLPFDIWKKLLMEELIKAVIKDGRRRIDAETIMGIAELFKWDEQAYSEKMKTKYAAEIINTAFTAFKKKY